MYTLNGKTLRLDTAFTTEDGRQFPRNWLRLSTKAERDALGIVETPDVVEPSYDQRFYWGPNLPKDHAQLIEQWVGQVKQTAGSLLAQTDWYITRHAETGTAIPQSVLDRRSLIRAMSNDKEAFLNLTTDTDMLAQYVVSTEFNNWESGSSIPGASSDTPVSVSDTDVIDFGSAGTTITGSGLHGGSGEDILTL